jgi:uncharacterized protein (TIGR02271 family)
MAELGDVRIDPGAGVEAVDGRLGTVDEVILHPDGKGIAYVIVRRGWSNEQLLVPAELIQSVNGPREVRLSVGREEAQTRAQEVPSEALLLARDRGTEVVIPIVEERLIPSKRAVELGELRIHKHVDEVEESVREAVTRDDLIVERIQVNQPLDSPVASRQDGEWTVFPIMREVLVVKKQLMLVEEVRVKTQQIAEEQEVVEITRHERLELEDATVHGVQGLGGSEGLSPPAGATSTDGVSAPPLGTPSDPRSASRRAA